MAMLDLKWSASEKKVAHQAFEAARHSALAGIVAEFKAKAAAAATVSDMWAIEDYLGQRRREIEELFDYRYSQLPLVFARLIGEGHLSSSRVCRKRNWRSFASSWAREAKPNCFARPTR